MLTAGSTRIFGYLTALLLLMACAPSKTIPVIGEPPQLGIIADCQYADQATRGVRFYALSDTKLATCIDTFNQLPLSRVFHLGDFIDLGGQSSMDAVLPLMDRLKSPHTFVLGNHDFEFPDEVKKDVPKILGLKRRYFSMKMEKWKFIVLDGNDVSLYAWPADSEQHRSAQAIHQTRFPQKEVYNGALGEQQLEWLKTELQKAEKAAEKVILLCHFPILPIDNHVLWNSDEILQLISPFSCVKAWLNGHNHAGAYTEYQGIHFVTFKGMVDTEMNSFATVLLQNNQLIIKGYGREVDRELDLR